MKFPSPRSMLYETPSIIPSSSHPTLSNYANASTRQLLLVP